MLDKVRIQTRNDFPVAIEELKAWAGDTFKRNKAWIITFFSCITFGYVGLHALLRKNYLKFAASILTFGFFGLGIMSETLVLLRNKYPDKEEGVLKVSWHPVVRILLFFLYLVFAEIVLILVLDFFGVGYSDLQNFDIDEFLQKMRDYIEP
ncbi:MAG: hypothetical protein ACLFQK_05190 [Fibrobacterota bacterium]